MGHPLVLVAMSLGVPVAALIVASRYEISKYRFVGIIGVAMFVGGWLTSIFGTGRLVDLLALVELAAGAIVYICAMAFWAINEMKQSQSN